MKKLSETNLSVRAINCLRAADITTVEELLKFSKGNELTDLIKFRNFGWKSFSEVKKFVELNEVETKQIIIENMTLSMSGCDSVNIDSYELGLSDMYDRLKDE